ncbi:MAG: gluconokinase [Phycicoccus sp.]
MDHSRGEPDVIVVMGVASVGKTTVAKGLSTLTGWVFAEGDAFHPEANIAKMSAGHPLTDDDRLPWLHAIRAWMTTTVASGDSAVVTCSALRRSYRDVLRGAGPSVRFLHLSAPESLVGDRISSRSGHFMPPSLLQSQFDTLEPLGDDELVGGSVVVSVDGTAAEVLRRCAEALGLSPCAGRESSTGTAAEAPRR